MKKPAHSFRLVPVLIVTALIAVGLVAGIYVYLSKTTKPSVTPTVTQTAVNALPENSRARRTILQPNKSARLQVYTADKAVITVEFEAGSVTASTPVTVLPLVPQSGYIAGIILQPETLRLKKPASVTVDISRTDKHFSGSDTISISQTTYVRNARALRIQDKQTTTAFVAHPLTTNTQMTMRVITGGSYVAYQASDDSLLLARKTLQISEVGSLALMEAGLEVLDKKNALTQIQKKELQNAADKLINAKEKVSAFELLTASILSEQLKQAKTVSFIPRVVAQGNNFVGYLEFQCKSDHSIQEYVMYAQNAQLFGYDSIAEGCMTAAKNKVADEAREVLGKGSPSLQELVQMLGKVQMFGLDELDIALQDKIAKVAKKNAEDILKDPNATPEEIVKRLQELQATTNETELGNQLEAKARDAVAAEVQKTLSDPQATMTEVAVAMQKAQSFGLDTQANQAGDRLKQMSTRSYEEILNNPRASAQELSNAWADAYEKGIRGEELAEIKKKWKEKEKEEAKPTPTPSPRQGDDEENLEFIGVDENLFGLAMAQMFGLQSFDEAGLKAFGDQKREEGQQMNEATLAMCELLDDPEFVQLKNMTDVPGLDQMYTEANTMCATEVESGKAMRDLDKAVDDLYEFAEEVGETQAQDYEEKDQSPHMEFEITPTPEPEEVKDSDIGTQESEFYSEEYQEAQGNEGNEQYEGIEIN